MKEETLGQVLRRYREETGLKIEKVEKDTKISKRMLLALENDNYEVLPEELYVKNLIKTYGGYLSLDYNKLLNLYSAKRGETKKSLPIKKGKNKIYITPKIFRYILVAALLLALLVYLAMQINKIFSPPKLFILEPDKSFTTSQNYVEVKGQTEKEASVYINGKEIFIDSDGGFAATLDLQKGLNTIKISASKKHSKENVIFREILVQ